MKEVNSSCNKCVITYCFDESGIGSVFAGEQSTVPGTAKQPFVVTDGLFDQAKTESDLGLSKIEGAETVTVFTATDDTDHYCNGVVMTEFKGKLYTQWQSSAKDEDAEDTWVAYSVSDDNGATWSEPKVLVPTIDNGYCSSGGWFVSGDTLVSYINVWYSDTTPRGGFAYYVESTDGEHWSEMKPVLMKDGTPMEGIIEQDPHVLASGRIVNAAHFQPGLLHIQYIQMTHQVLKAGLRHSIPAWNRAKVQQLQERWNQAYLSMKMELLL